MIDHFGMVLSIIYLIENNVYVIMNCENITRENNQVKLIKVSCYLDTWTCLVLM